MDESMGLLNFIHEMHEICCYINTRKNRILRAIVLEGNI